MAVFGIEVQRRVRLRNAQRFDLTAILGESDPVIVHIGEMPQSQQPKVAEYLNMRHDLFALGLKLKREDETPEDAIRRVSSELADDSTVLQAAAAMGATRAGKLLEVMQELIGAALLDSKGDRMSAEDARAMFDLMPSSPESAAVLQRMTESVLNRLGLKKQPPAAGEAAAPAAEQPVGK
jgi:hypothetical protein